MDLSNIEIILSVATVIISIVVFISDRMQTEGQVRPHLNIFSGSHRNQVYIRIANCGMGPGVIESLKVEKHDMPGGQRQPLLDLHVKDVGQNKQPLSLAHYVYDEIQNTKYAAESMLFESYIPFDSILGRAVSIDDSLMLFQFTSDDEELCDAVREIVCKLMISLTYRDTFGKLINTPCERDCSWMAATMCTNGGPILMHTIDNGR